MSEKQNKRTPERRCRMEFRGDSESASAITITAKVVRREVMNAESSD
jgi:hypothetical protein